MTDDIHAIGPYVLIPVEEYEYIKLRLKSYRMLEEMMRKEGEK